MVSEAFSVEKAAYQPEVQRSPVSVFVPGQKGSPGIVQCGKREYLW